MFLQVTEISKIAINGVCRELSFCSQVGFECAEPVVLILHPGHLGSAWFESSPFGWVYSLLAGLACPHPLVNKARRFDHSPLEKGCCKVEEQK